jgi:hypothetical protein
MRTALLLSGQIRNAKQSHYSIQTHLIDRYQADVFISTWKPASQIVGAVGYPIEDDTSVDELIRLYNPKELCLEDFQSLPVLNTVRSLPLYNKTAYDGTHIEEVNFENTFFQNYKRAKGVNLIAYYQQINNMKYDCVIVSRFDVTFDTFPYIVPKPGEIYIPIGTNKGSPEYHFGGLRDVFALGNYESMLTYCTLFNHLCGYHDSGHGLHPESILRKHLELNNLNIKRFPVMSSLRGTPIV